MLVAGPQLVTVCQACRLTESALASTTMRRFCKMGNPDCVTCSCTNYREHVIGLRLQPVTGGRGDGGGHDIPVSHQPQVASSRDPERPALHHSQRCLRLRHHLVRSCSCLMHCSCTAWHCSNVFDACGAEAGAVCLKMSVNPAASACSWQQGHADCALQQLLQGVMLAKHWLQGLPAKVLHALCSCVQHT